jgi:DNA-binding PadR family transcriptional regulator
VAKALKHRDLVILGLLMEQPRYGYEIKTLLDNALAHLVNINSGSLYYGLKKLQATGYVKEAAVEKIGRRPERSVYELTPAGRQVFSEEVLRQIFPVGGDFNPLEYALYFFQVLEREEVLRRLTMRQTILLETILFFKELLLDVINPLNVNHRLIIQHKLLMLEAEVSFIDLVFVEFKNSVFIQLSDQDLASISSFITAYKQSVLNGLGGNREFRLPDLTETK